jgi:thioredoxin
MHRCFVHLTVTLRDTNDSTETMNRLGTARAIYAPNRQRWKNTMATFNLTEADLKKQIEDNDILIIDFWASWCGPCRTFAPVFEAASVKHEDVAFAKVNTEEERVIAGQFGIRSIPTLAAFKDGEMVFKQAGALPPQSLDALIEQLRGLDMDEVRKSNA